MRTLTHLAAALKQETHAAIDESETKHQAQSFTVRINELETALASSNKTLEEKEHKLKPTLIELSAREASEEVSKAQENKLKQTEVKLQAMLAEKQFHIKSLEEKHRHNWGGNGTLPTVCERAARSGSAKA